MKGFGNWRGILLLLALLLCLAGCGGNGEGEEVLPQPEVHEAAQEEAVEEVSLPAEEPMGEISDHPITLVYYVNEGVDPYTCANTLNRALISLLYEPLFSLSPAFEPEPALALSCEKTGEGRWRIALREGVLFWDGTELTARDVIWSLERAKAPGSLYAQRLAPLGEMEAEGDYALTLSWAEERGRLDLLLEIPIVQQGTAGDTIPMGTGPYLPVLGEGGAEYLAANGSWQKGGELPLSSIGLRKAYTSDDVLGGFEREEISLVPSDLTAPDGLSYSGAYEPWDYATSHLIYLGCNTTEESPCRDNALRRALLISLDRETIVQSLLSGHGAESFLAFHPSSGLYDRELAEALREEMQPSLEPWQEEELELVVSADSDFKVAIARSAAAAWEEAGLKVRVRELSWSEYQEALAARDYDLYLGEVKLEPDFDLTALVGEEGPLNFCGYHTPELEQALEDYRLAGAEEAAEAAGELSEVLARECPILPVCFEEHSVLAGWGKFETMTPTQGDLFYRFEDWTTEK